MKKIVSIEEENLRCPECGDILFNRSPTDVIPGECTPTLWYDSDVLECYGCSFKMAAGDFAKSIGKSNVYYKGQVNEPTRRIKKICRCKASNRT